MLTSLIPILRRAGRAALDIYEGGFTVSHKADCTPVTEADVAVDEIVVSALQKAYPAIPVVSEERVASLAAARACCTGRETRCTRTPLPMCGAASGF